MTFKYIDDIKARVDRLTRLEKDGDLDKYHDDIESLRTLIESGDLTKENIVSILLQKIMSIEDDICSGRSGISRNRDIFFYTTVAKLLSSISARLKDTGIPLSTELLALKTDVEGIISGDRGSRIEERLDRIITLVQWHDILDQEVNNLCRVLQSYSTLGDQIVIDKQSILDLFEQFITTESELKVLKDISDEYELKKIKLDDSLDIEIFKREEDADENSSSGR